MTPPRVCVVTVTYGDRWQFLSKVLHALSNEEFVRDVVIVDNGSVVDLAQRIALLPQSPTRLLKMNGNCGSASGYAAGLRAAHATDADFVWLLDDDNLPLPGSLNHLLTQFKHARKLQPGSPLALLALRADRPQYVQAANGVPISRCFPWPTSFLGFHLVQTGMRKLRRLFGCTDDLSGPTIDRVSIPYGIYGGMFFERTLLDQVGYPDERFFLYGDDTEFTLRITRAGGLILLVSHVQVQDLETTWHAIKRTSISPFLENCLNASEMRLYYSMRNGAYIWHKYFASDSLMYRFNRRLYLGILKYYLRRHNASARYALIHRAIREGETGKLGIRDCDGEGNKIIYAGRTHENRPR
jgi:GT2 family glycosyltransferase